jgi:sugar O-acyltransferase (sialic acid O-acetyltransferase NeuD family)
MKPDPKKPGSPRCVILGGGGHACVLIDCIRESGLSEIEGILEADSSLRGRKVLDVLVLGGDELLRGLAAGGVTHFVVGLGGVGDNGPRRRLFELGCSCRLIPLTVRHPSAMVSRWATIGRGCQLLPGSIVNAGAALGKNVIVNSGAIVEHDCDVGDHVHIATGARLASTVRVGMGAHVGASATVRQCIRIGTGVIVGAGAVVVKDVEPGAVVAGVPARSIRQKKKES